jgi:hypothetical protein
MASSDAPAEPVFPLVVREAGEAVWSEAVLQVDGGGSDDESGASTSVSIWRDLSTAATFLRAATDAATNAPGSVVHWLLLRVTIKFFEDRFLPEGRSIVTEVNAPAINPLSCLSILYAPCVTKRLCVPEPSHKRLLFLAAFSPSPLCLVPPEALVGWVGVQSDITPEYLVMVWVFAGLRKIPSQSLSSVHRLVIHAILAHVPVCPCPPRPPLPVHHRGSAKYELGVD